VGELPLLPDRILASEFDGGGRGGLASKNPKFSAEKFLNIFIKKKKGVGEEK